MLDYRENSYFIENEMVLFKVPSINRYFIKSAEFYNGNWYAGNYKLSSIPSARFKDIYHFEVEFQGVKGKITKALENTLGINWEKGIKNLPYYWNEVNKIL